MSCPFGFGGLRQAQAMDAAQRERLATEGDDVPTGLPTVVIEPMLDSPSRVQTPSPGPTINGVFGPAPPQQPLGLWTGGLRTSLGVENAHPIAVWMKEMQARGGLKGVDIDAELLGLSLSPAEAQAQQANKNWKEKRERPPVDLANLGLASPPAPVPSPSADGSPTHPTQLHFYPGMFGGRIDHNSHSAQSPMNKYDQEITYWNYIHPHVLSSLQNGRQGKGLNHHDEHLFILVHQVFELWFKQILWELEYVRNCLLGYRDPLQPKLPAERNPLARCIQRLDRADKIMRLATEGYAIMETMDPSDFLEFRDFLSPSSGFQSTQLREIEILLGLKDEERIPCAGRHYREAFMANGENKTGIFDERLAEKTLKEALYIFLRRATPSSQLDQFKDAYFQVLHTQNTEKSKDFEEELTLLQSMLARATDEREKQYLADLAEKATFGRTLAANSSQDVARFFADPALGQPRTAALFLFTYHTHPDLKDAAELVNGFLRFEQAVLLWRQRHARMVETFIGRRPGTGGSSGVEYIDQTASAYRIFTDLWRIRSLCVARSKIAFSPDAGALYQGHYMENLTTDIEAVKARIDDEQREIKERIIAHARREKEEATAATTPTANGIGPDAHAEERQRAI